jgi:parallel beta-helix repeat protein
MITLFGLFNITLKADTWVVDTTGAEGDSLQVAINNAWLDPGIDTVLVGNGTYHLFINDTTGLIMHDSVVLMSQNGALVCTLSGLKEDLSDTAYHVIWINNIGYDTLVCRAVIRGFSIMYGNARGSSSHSEGGGIYCRLSSPTIDSCIISNNLALAHGGGFCINTSSYPRITDNTVENNSADGGGGIYIYFASPGLLNNIIGNNSASNGAGLYIYGSPPVLVNNKIEDNQATNVGGGLCIHQSSPTLTDNIITNNSANAASTFLGGGGIWIGVSSSPILTNNIIENNSTNPGSGCGGGICINTNSSPILTNNIITNNSAYGGGGIYIYDGSSPVINNNTISSNLADFGAGLGILRYSSVKLNKCLMSMNVAGKGGAIYDTSHSIVVIDSSFIVDNGNLQDNMSGLAYLTQDSDTFRVSYSNIYYNTFQPDTEIYNLTSITIPVQYNFWWYTNDDSISALIYGPNNHANWFNDFIPGVPGEPISVDSVRNYTDTTYSVLCDSIWQPDTLYLRIYGQDRNTSLREAAVAILESSVYPQGIAVTLMENDTNSGIYQGKAYVLNATANDTIRTDDIYQRVKVASTGDTITIYANINPGRFWNVVYKPLGIAEQKAQPVYEMSRNIPNPFSNYTVIKYQMGKESRVTIKVFDITGSFLCTLVDGLHKPDCFEIIWNGENDKGKKLPAGVYFYVINTGEFKSTHKAVIVR